MKLGQLEEVESKKTTYSKRKSTAIFKLCPSSKLRSKGVPTHLYYKSYTTMDVPFVCNNCLENIHGFRYKCGLCWDYDLCWDCLQLDEIVGHDHDPATHVLIKLSVEGSPARRSERIVDHSIRSSSSINSSSSSSTSSTSRSTEDSSDVGSYNDLLERLTVLDGLQYFYLNVEAISEHLKMPLLLVRLHVDRLIKDEFSYSQCAASAFEIVPDMVDSTDESDGSGFLRETIIRDDIDLEASWPSIMALSEEKRVDLDGTYDTML